MDENTENEVTEQETTVEETTTEQAEPETVEQEQPAEEAKTEDESDESNLGSFLDTISEGTPEKKQEEQEHQPDPDRPMTADDVEKELLSGVKSDRGRERVRDFIKDHKSMETEYQSVKRLNDDFANMVRNTGMSAEEFGKTIEYCRLASSRSPDDLRLALNMIEEQRKNLCLQLGIDAPGVDPLEGFDDLKKQVDAYEMPAETASELARLRRKETAYNQQVQQQMAQQQQDNLKRQEIINFTEVANNTFRKLAQTDPNYKQKEQKLLQYIKTGNVMQQLLNTFHPSQWTSQLKLMYDLIPAQTPIRNTPLRARPARIGGNAELNMPEGPGRISALLDNLGI